MGLKTDDITVGVNGRRVKGMRLLIGWVHQYAVGNTVDLQIMRDDKETKVLVTLQTR